MISDHLQQLHPEELEQFLDRSDSLFVLVCDEDFKLLECSGEFRRMMEISGFDVDRSLCELILDPNGGRCELPVPEDLPETRIVRLKPSGGLHRISILKAGSGAIIIGEKLATEDTGILQTMSRLTSEAMNLTRDLRKKNRELEEANRRITELIRTDPLTGLSNRRHFDEMLSIGISFTRRHALPLSVVITDIDSFKEVNDTFGHDAGDEVLRTFTGILRQGCRLEDIATRYGGDEFILLLQNADREQSAAVAEKIRERFAASDPLGNGRRVTASFGIATLEEADTPEDLLKRADLALYRAKNRGRNRTAVG